MDVGAKGWLSAQEDQALRARSNVMGFYLVLHAWGTIFLAMALFVAWPNPLTFLLAVILIGGRQLGLAILMHDGFSVLSKPLYEGPLTEEIKAVAGAELCSNRFSLIDRDCYFARLSPDGSVKVYRRLNPCAPSGHCVGNLEHLA